MDNTAEEVDNQIQQIEEELKESEENSSNKGGKKKKMVLCTSQTKHSLVKQTFKSMGYKLDKKENSDWDLYWADERVEPTFFQKI